MSDFLDKFTKDKYDELLESKDLHKPVSDAALDEAIEDSIEASNTQGPVAIKDSKVNVGKRQDTMEEINRDPHYQQKKIIQNGLLALAALILVVGGFFAYRMINHRNVPELVNKPLKEIQEWAKKSGIDLDLKSEFSLDFDEDYIISANKKSGDSVQKGDIIKITYSKGADPNEHLKVPDFMTMDKTKIMDWINKNKATNIKVIEEFSATVKKNIPIRFEYADTTITSDTYTRKDYATVVISKGEQTFEKNIEVPDFVDGDYQKVSDWAQKNEIKITKEEGYSNTIEMGKVVSQSIEAKTKIAKNDTITIVVSKGKARIVPNFAVYNLESIKETGSSEDVPYIVVERYSASVAYGQLISQDVAPGTIIENDNVKQVILTFSIGNPYIPRDMVFNQTEKAIRDYFYELNQKGANISYVLQSVNPSACDVKPATKGLTCGSNYDNQFINIGGQIILKIANADSPHE